MLTRSGCVFGSAGTCPLVKIGPPATPACEYGPIALGAFSVDIVRSGMPRNYARAPRASSAVRSIDPDAALPVLVVGPVLVLADPSLGLVLQRASAALDPLLARNPVAVGDVLDGMRASGGGQQQKKSGSLHTLSTECTPGIWPMARNTSLSCFTSAISTSKVLTAPSPFARAFACTMLTPTSANVSLIRASRPLRSSLITRRLTTRLKSACTSQATSTRRSRSVSIALRQPWPRTVTPRPRVMNPTMGSPGTGAQHFP